METALDPWGKRVPVMRCESVLHADGTKRWRFLCPYCRHHHYHGAKAGYRVAHCTGIADDGERLIERPSPLMDTGYVIRLKKAVAT
jgi:hypothetical protein